MYVNTYVLEKLVSVWLRAARGGRAGRSSRGGDGRAGEPATGEGDEVGPGAALDRAAARPLGRIPGAARGAAPGSSALPEPHRVAQDPV